MVERISTETERAGGGFMAFDCGLAKAGCPLFDDRHAGHFSAYVAPQEFSSLAWITCKRRSRAQAIDQQLSRHCGQITRASRSSVLIHRILAPCYGLFSGS